MASDALLPVRRGSPPATRFRPSHRRGVAILSVLAVIFLFTLLGYAILKLSNRDTYLSDALIDIKSRELAAQSGFETVLGRLEARPFNAATLLQAFVADSGLAEASKRRWFVLTADSVYVSNSDADAWHSIAANSGSRAAFKVRIVGIDAAAINTGSAGGAGIDILLESTGRDRKGNEAKVEAVYRVFGLDVPLVQVITMPPPVNALFLNGAGDNIDLGANLVGGVFLAQGGKIQGGTVNITGPVRSGGNLIINAQATITGNTYVKGTLEMQANATFNGNLAVTGGFATMNKNITVTRNATIYGTNNFGSWNTTSLNVGQQLWIRDYAPLSVNGNSTDAIVVGGNAYINRLNASNQARIHVQGNLELTGAGTNAIENLYVGGDFAARNARSTLSFAQSLIVRGSFHHNGDINITGGLDSIIGNMRVDSGFTGINANTYIMRSLYSGRVGQQGGFNRPLSIGEDLIMNGSLVSWGWNPFGSGAKWRRLTRGGTWSYRDNVSMDAAIDSFQTIRRRATDTTFPDVVTPYNPPRSLAEQGYTKWDTTTSIDSQANQPDTIREQAIPAAMTKTLTEVCSEYFSYNFTQCQNNIANALGGDMLNQIWQKFQAANNLYNGYMVLKFATTDPSTNFTGSGLFANKAIFLIDRNMGDMGAKWPGGVAGSRQVLKILTNGTMSQWGPQANTDFYGIVYWNRATTDKVQFGAGARLFGTIEYAVPGSTVQMNSGGSLNIDVSTGNVLGSMQAEIPDVLRFANINGTGTISYVSSKTISVARGGTTIQFRRISERR